MCPSRVVCLGTTTEDTTNRARRGGGSLAGRGVRDTELPSIDEDGAPQSSLNLWNTTLRLTLSSAKQAYEGDGRVTLELLVSLDVENVFAGPVGFVLSATTKTRWTELEEAIGENVGVSAQAERRTRQQE